MPPCREQEARDAWRQQVLAQVDAATLAPHWKNRLLMRRASVTASLAFAQARRGAGGEALPALADFAAIAPTELTEDDQTAYNDAAMRVNAARWLGTSVAARDFGAVTLTLQTGADGERCVELKAAGKLAARRCSFGQVALASASLNREGGALALAVQPLDGWRELWLFIKEPGRNSGWRVEVMPPAPAQPGLGVAEFAGWVPGGAQGIAGARVPRRGQIPPQLRGGIARQPGHRAPVARAGLARRLPALVGCGLARGLAHSAVIRGGSGSSSRALRTG